MASCIKKMNQDDAVVALVAAVSFLKKHAELTGKVGAVGFCFGGLMVNRLAVESRELDAGVPYYGRQPADADVAKITAPLLIHYAENDKGVNAGIEAFEKALKAEQEALHDPHLSGHAARLQQRHRQGALRQGRRRPRLGPHARLLQGDARRAAQRGLAGALNARTGPPATAASIFLMAVL